MSNCIVWTRAKSAAGYGQRWQDGKVAYVHRAAWEEVNGPIPAGMFVCHRCDNRACYNVAHLFLGTAADNNRDMRDKGRGVNPPDPTGSRNPAARLTETQVQAIRADTRFLREVAADYGVSIAAVHEIRTRKTWRSVA